MTVLWSAAEGESLEDFFFDMVETIKINEISLELKSQETMRHLLLLPARIFFLFYKRPFFAG